MATTSLFNYPSNYQLSTLGVGIIAAGIEDIRQSIGLILGTIRGTDPFRPLFGSDIYLYQDKPVQFAIAGIKKSIFDSLEAWEPRITILSITHTINSEQIILSITYRTVDDVIDTVGYGIGTGIIREGDLPSNGIILTAIIPAKVIGGLYSVEFIVDGSPAFPLVPGTGFESASDLYSWVTSNWFNYGRWYMNGNSLILYMNPGIATSSSLSVTQKVSIQVRRAIPEISDNQRYSLTLTLDGIEALPAFPNNITTVESLLFWLNNNYGDYGSWYVQSGGMIVSAGDFSEEFSSDFDLGGVFVPQTLIFDTTLFNSADFTLTVIDI